MADFILRKLIGLNNSDPVTEIRDDQAVVATNVEFNKSSLGERRLGCDNITLPAAITGDANIQAISFLHQHFPTSDETASELWVLGQHLTTQNFVLVRKTTAWATATLVDDIDVTSGRGFGLSAKTIHGKLFLAFRSVGGVDRLHVVDTSGTNVRRAGLAEPAAPTAADTAVAGTYSGVRYFRIRYVVLSGTTVLRRSEPSDTLTFTPNGSFTGAVVTKPASISESETHWELEASTDNANFYRIARTVVGTTTVTDTTDYTSGYANVSGAVLSEDIGDYSLIHSGKFLAADEDRLLIGGSWENSEYASRVSWTTVYNEPGVGNDERIPTDTDNFLDLDGFEGGPLTHLADPVDGAIWAFKYSHTYKLIRTGIRSRAYQAFNISKHIGAIQGSVVEGTDNSGMPCLYFLDPETGPCRTGGSRVIQSVGRDISETWDTINRNGIVVARAAFYHEKNQVHWWIATDGSNYPNLKIILQTSNTEETSDGIRGGWSLATGTITNAYSVCMYAENIEDNTTRSLVLRPFIGVSSANGYVLKCDTGNDDNGTAYSARIVTKPFIVRSLLQKFGVGAAALLAKAHATASVVLTLIRDFGLEEPREVTTTLAATGSETDVIKQLRNLTGAQFYAVQIEFSDPAVPAGQWELNRFDMALGSEEGMGKKSGK